MIHRNRPGDGIGSLGLICNNSLAPAPHIEQAILAAAAVFKGPLVLAGEILAEPFWLPNEIGWLAWPSDRRVRHFVAACYGILL